MIEKEDIDFAKLQIDKANGLTDLILAKIGEMYLKKEIGPSEGIFGLGTIAQGPKEEINQVILTWLTGESIDG